MIADFSSEAVSQKMAEWLMDPTLGEDVEQTEFSRIAGVAVK